MPPLLLSEIFLYNRGRMAKHATGCLICGEELVYLEQAETQTCVYCGQEQVADARCILGHYVCDACHRAGANDLIERFCASTTLADPLEMAVVLMKHPTVHIHGPEHHFLVPAVLLAAYYNQQGSGEKAAKIRQARKRSETVAGGSCGFFGNCGAGVGTGIFISLITGATPLSKKEWQLSNRMTAECLLTIAEHGGPRCCKRDTYLALLAAKRFLHENFAIEIEMNETIVCQFFGMNRECLKQDCPFFPA